MKSKIVKEVFILVFVFSIIACKEDCKDIRVPYIVKIPYTEEVIQPVKLEYKESSFIHDRNMGKFGIVKPQLTASITITNVSKYDGNFVLMVTWESLGQELKGLGSAFIATGMSKKITINQECEHNSFKVEETSVKKFEIIAPEIDVKKFETKYKEEVRYKLCNSCNKTDCKE